MQELSQNFHRATYKCHFSCMSGTIRRRDLAPHFTRENVAQVERIALLALDHCFTEAFQFG
jgi:hypothetical protein